MASTRVCANGNTQVINAAGSLTTYAWDIENHLTVAQLPAGTRTTATYDGDGKRRSYHDSAGFRSIVWDAENILVEADSGGSTIARYSMNPQAHGDLISQRRSGATAFYHYDALGSTRALTNAAQTTTDTADYEAFGLANASSGSTTYPFRWVGQLGYYRQADTSDFWVRARVYRPQVGRWVSRDPVDGRHPYRYVDGRPVVMSDPSGLQPGATIPQRIALAHQIDTTGCDTDVLDPCLSAAAWSRGACLVGCGLGVSAVSATSVYAAVLWLVPPFWMVAAGLTIFSLTGFFLCWRTCNRRYADDLADCWLAWRRCRHDRLRVRRLPCPPGPPPWAGRRYR